MIKNLAIFCGAKTGKNLRYAQETETLADVLSQQGISVIYGGAKVGLMGILADRLIRNQSKVIGVMPRFLVEVEIAHEGLTEFHVVNSMQERKSLMAELADGFMMLPGGGGSLDEFFEMFTWGQLGYHNKACGILNTAGYYDKLLEFLDNSVAQGFLKSSHRNSIIVHEEPQALLQAMQSQPCFEEKNW